MRESATDVARIERLVIATKDEAARLRMYSVDSFRATRSGGLEMSLQNIPDLEMKRKKEERRRSFMMFSWPK